MMTYRVYRKVNVYELRMKQDRSGDPVFFKMLKRFAKMTQK